MKKIIFYYIQVFLFYLFRLFPIQKNKIFIQNFNGKGYGDNPKYIVEEILRRGLDFALVWAVRTEFAKDFPQTVRIVPYKSVRAIYEEATAKIWIDNCRKQLYVRKRKGQCYIQTWHGTVNLKKVEKDVESQLSAYYVKQAKWDSTLVNLFLSDSKFTSQLYRTSFWYTGEILECGSPRDDILFNRDIIIKEKVKKIYNIDSNVKIILYAPTFRDNFSIDVYNIDFTRIINCLSEKTNEQWVFLIRIHPNISEKSKYFVYDETIFNASHYSDMQELLLASDILISDYSDCMYEFAFMDKPVFLFINDYEQYKKERDFYFDLFTLPFPHAMNTNELLQKIINFDTVQYLILLKEFFLKVGIVKDGTASKRVVDRISTEIGNK
jgi:CDP-glycerol glycerophosphotransferase